MDSPKLADLKKELNYRDAQEWKELCLKLAKYKTENKELLHYLLFYSDRKEDYVEEVKAIIANTFDDLHPSIYQATKQLRKLVRVMNKHIKYISDKACETELVLYLSTLFIEHPIVKINSKSSIGLLYRQLKRALKLIPKLDEDLQFDYQQQFDEVIAALKKKRSAFSLREIE
ncbi:hypothetical protein N9R54_01590 [Pelobium sp.]|nr:hypothetical protein [Pelobium sp.]MDA9554904.1 hypothetical protein [Pelobium sp.]